MSDRKVRRRLWLVEGHDGTMTGLFNTRKQARQVAKNFDRGYAWNSPHVAVCFERRAS